MRLLVVVEQEALVVRVDVAEVEPRAGHPGDLVGAVAETGRVHPVGRAVLGVLVVPGIGEVVVDGVDVVDLVPVDAAQQVARDQALHVLAAREDQVVGDPGAQLGGHRRHRVEVRLAHLHPVLLLEALDERGVDVLGVVEVEEVAVDLLRDRLLRVFLAAPARVADAAAGQPGDQRHRRAVLQQVPAADAPLERAPQAARRSPSPQSLPHSRFHAGASAASGNVQPSSRSASVTASSRTRLGVTSASRSAICTDNPSSSEPIRTANRSGSAGPNSPRS